MQRSKDQSVNQRWWLIQGYDGTSRFLKCEVPFGLLTEGAAAVLLQRLAASHLTHEEIIRASVRRKTKGHSPALQVVREPRERVTLSVGENPHYIASVMTRGELDDFNNA